MRVVIFTWEVVDWCCPKIISKPQRNLLIPIDHFHMKIFLEYFGIQAKESEYFQKIPDSWIKIQEFQTSSVHSKQIPEFLKRFKNIPGVKIPAPEKPMSGYKNPHWTTQYRNSRILKISPKPWIYIYCINPKWSKSENVI